MRPNLWPAAYCRSDVSDDPLERLSSKELHDLAVDHAKRHLDAGFFCTARSGTSPASAMRVAHTTPSAA